MARTVLSGWQIRREDRDDIPMKYVELNHITKAHIPNDNVVYRLSFPDKVEGISIKTIRIVAEDNVPFMVDILDESLTESIYESLEETKYHYDQVDIPYLPTDKALFVNIHNRGSVTTKFDIKIKGLEVR